MAVTLFEMTAKFEELFDRYEEIVEYEPEDGSEDPEEYRRAAEEAWFTTLSCMEDDIETKAENVAKFIQTLEAAADALKTKEDRIKARRRARENAAKRLRAYLISCLDAARLSKIDRPDSDTYISIS